MLFDCHKHDFPDAGALLPRPVIHVQKDAIFYPKDDKYEAQPWGVYDLWGRIIPACALGNNRIQLDHGQSWIVGNQRTAYGIPEIECAVYGGMLGLHYGHMLLEFLPRLWYLRGKYGPSAKILVHCAQGLKAAWETQWFRDMMALLRVTENDLISPSETILVRNLLVPEASFQINGFCLQTFADFTHWMGDRVPVSEDTNEAPYFLTKMQLKNGVINYVNENELCSSLEDLGFRIVATESLPFYEQIGLFKSSAGTCGMLGSNMHTSIFSRNAYGTVFNIGPDISKSFDLLDAATGADFHYVSSGTLQEVAAQPGFRRSFHLEDPIALARAIHEDFYAKKAAREHKVRQRSTHTSTTSDQHPETPREFHMVRSTLGKLLCIRAADGALITVHDLPEDETAAYPAVVTRSDLPDELLIFALSPQPTMICSDTETLRKPFLSCRLTEAQDQQGNPVHALQSTQNGRWLVFIPDNRVNTSFSAQKAADWEFIQLETLPAEKAELAAAHYETLQASKNLFRKLGDKK